MATATANPPIYQLLVEEHGDVLAATRDAVRETQRAASAALDWSDLRPARRAVEQGRADNAGGGARDRTREPGREPGPRPGATAGTPAAGAEAPEAEAPEAGKGSPEAGKGGPEDGAEAGWFGRPEQAGPSGRETPGTGTAEELRR
ncbi:hypothetical protein KBZ10_02745 [Streptomyces sp. F63]|uniref:hypothetical protein n=1 Tax=Streptomyces sp. F63 TaxID=2824887 RepID=UPI001B37F1F8|nr:hypothetical protein [Streptomyces sp. F63]MBQ0983467.1 hypothetical protein [Streptomyces sp. F63]